MQVELYVDPACGWSQVAVRWLQAAAAARHLDVCLRPYSLLLRDGEQGPPSAAARRRASLRALRLMAAGDPARASAFWDAVVQQDGPQPFPEVEAAAADAGLDAPAGAADDEALDEAVRRWMSAAEVLAAGPAVLPLLALDGRVALTGPLLREAPDGDAAVTLWDALLDLASTEGFYEVTRRRPPHPALRGLPDVPVPAALPAAARPLGRFVREYLQRVVNHRDVSAVDELVAPDYTGDGYGWPADRDALRAFYLQQARERPDWQIQVQETVEQGTSVVVRAHAGAAGAGPRPQVTWLAHYRVVDGRIQQIQVLSLVKHD